jgi:hypothetical protein
MDNLMIQNRTKVTARGGKTRHVEERHFISIFNGEIKL